MVTATQPPAAAGKEESASWAPMIAISLAQVLMSFNVAAIPVSLSGMVESFNAPPTTIATGVVMYGLAVAALVMLGAKLTQRFGARIIFQLMTAIFIISQAMMTFAPTATVMIAAQGFAGAAAAALVPSLVALIAIHYSGPQQAVAIGMLGSARAIAGVAAFTIGGLLATFVSWRPTFALLMVVAVIILALSFKLKRDEGRPEVEIDWIGVLLTAVSITFISFGFNNLNGWGLTVATPAAPFTIAGVSPAPLMIIVGIVLLQLFVRRCRQVAARGSTPLLDLRVVMSPAERAAVITMFAIVALEGAINFTVPLYIQIVQGQSPLATSIAMMPFLLTVFFTAILVVRLYDKVTPRTIGRAGFMICTAALLWLAFVVHNDWSTIPVLIGLIAFGIGQGALVTLVFNVLVTAAPKELAGDVGSLRGTTQNLASAVGTAVAAAMMVGLLSISVMRMLVDNPYIPPELQAQLNLDNINFVSNDRLLGVMEGIGATPEQVSEAVRINTEMRLRALKVGLLLLAAISALTILPAGRLPNYKPGEIPVNPPQPTPEEEKQIVRDLAQKEAVT